MRKLVVIGIGLMGGSCALALRRAGAVDEIVGIGRTRANLDAALALGMADRVATLDESWTRELAGADVVLIATPLAQYPALFAVLAQNLASHTVVTDAGSTKQDVVAAARAHLGADIARFVPAHPIAGSERSGPAAADAGLYVDRQVVLTPLAETSPEALRRVSDFWRACGARIVTMDAGRHDRILAAVSHLPHLLAFAYMGAVIARDDAGDLMELAGTGFRDFTRIAASSPEMWRDIALANGDALLAECVAFREALREIEGAIAAQDGDKLCHLIARAADARRRWGERRGLTTGTREDDA